MNYFEAIQKGFEGLSAIKEARISISNLPVREDDSEYNALRTIAILAMDMVVESAENLLKLKSDQ